MKRHRIRQPDGIRHSTPDGEVVHVPVYGAMRYCLVNPKATPYAILDVDDFDRIVSEGYSRLWYLNAARKSAPALRYLRVKVPYFGNRMVSHLIAPPMRGQCVHYLDGNPLNLRRSNLALGSKGRTKGDRRAATLASAEFGSRSAHFPTAACRSTVEPSRTVATFSPAMQEARP